jgi:hypothetical protein
MRDKFERILKEAVAMASRSPCHHIPGKLSKRKKPGRE